ncbi:MAG: hypothetical protein LBD13_04725 [Spirochaetaceae bacterium]|nr:hypothetical protein [Spirochaetaceae bacterium]
MPEPPAAVLWTDRPEFAVYADSFNTSQSAYKVEVRYLENLAQALVETKETKKAPDILVGGYLKSAAARSLFRPLDRLFNEKTLARSAFYPRLLSMGAIDQKQYLLPVAFNIPAMVFARQNGQLLSNPFTVGLGEIRELGSAHNQESRRVYAKMGFSPGWDPEFLYIAADLFGAAFQEGSPLGWDEAALESAIQAMRAWTAETNGGIQAEDDFVFKYFYEPPEVLALSGRILFTYMDSAKFFTLPEERRANLDFRWLAEKERIPLGEGAVYYGIYKRGRARKASKAFTVWFFQAETQKALLEEGKTKRLGETLFGISSGFSALRSVTEQIFPQYYPSLLGHTPPDGFLTPSRILPPRWSGLKAEVVLPYLAGRIRAPVPEKTRDLERRIAEWYSQTF